MAHRLSVKNKLDKFLHILGTITSTYNSFPYFETPDHRFENKILNLINIEKLDIYDQAQVEEIANIMKDIIFFVSNVIPSTAVNKMKFIDNLTDEYKGIEKIIKNEQIKYSQT